MTDGSAGEGRGGPDGGRQCPDRRGTIDLVRVERGEPERRRLHRVRKSGLAGQPATPPDGDTE